MIAPDQDREQITATRRHPNDPDAVRVQLARSALFLTDEERVSLLAAIDRSLALLDGPD